jgi:hypothetical protein
VIIAKQISNPVLSKLRISIHPALQEKLSKQTRVYREPLYCMQGDKKTWKSIVINFSVTAGLVLCIGNAGAQSITDLINKGVVTGAEEFAQTHDINKLYCD